ncbi:MAG: SLC13 family permease [Chloroflexota bacterium]|nr:MAG: SLC13 family permease [Chloroflexota bacterium]
MQIAIVLGLLALAIVLFARETISVDVITALLLIGLVVTGILTPSEAFAGFSSDIIIILVSIFIISGALRQTGIMDAVGVRLYLTAGGGVNRLLLTIMALMAGLSAFMNNTTTTAVLMTPVIGVARQAKVSPSKLLLPLAYASMLGGACTLIGTSTNVAVSGYITQNGMPPLGLFELTPIGLILVGVGMVYMVVIGQHLLPDHQEKNLTEAYAIHEYLSEIIIVPGSHLIGQKVFESDLAKLGFRILAVLRGQDRFMPNPRSTIQAEDVLLVEGKWADLLRVKETAGIEIKADLQLGDRDLQGGDIRIAEALIIPQSDLIGHTLKTANFRQRYNLIVLAIYRHGQALRDQIGQIRLQLGDLLLVQGTVKRLDFWRRNPDFWVLEELKSTVPRRRKGLYVVAFFAGGLLLGGLGWLPLSVAFLTAAVLTLLFGCLAVEEAYAFIDWRLIILIGGMTAFGVAMEKTGAAAFLAQGLLAALEPLGIMAVMAGFFGLTILLTQPMSNAAAALVVLPVALSAAQRLSLNPRTFAIAIMLAASISFIAPFEPACLLVYGPGKYKFSDFIKTGLGLTLILTLVVLFLVPLFWPL